MAKALLTCIVLCISSLAMSQDKGKVIYDENAEARTVGSFHSVKVSHGIDLFISQGADEAVAVSAVQAGHRDRIRTVVENGVLKISFDDRVMGWNWRGRNMRAYVSVKTIREIAASGGSDVIVRGVLSCPNLNLKLSGGSDFNGEVQVTNLVIDQSGGSDSRVRGKAVNIKVEASGGSDFNGYDLDAEYAVIDVSGGSDADVKVSKELAAEASGGSDVNYKGSPVIKYKNASGGSSVTKRG